MKEFSADLGSITDQLANKTTYYLAKQIFDNIHAFVFIFDFELRMPVWINKYYETRMGYSTKDLENLSSDEFIALFHPESLEVFINRMVNYTEITDIDRKTIYKLKTKNKRWINMMIHSNVLTHTPEGKIKYLIGYGVEIEQDELLEGLSQLTEIENKSDRLIKLSKLSKREVEIVDYIANCYTDKEIAEKLKISVNTSKTHRKRIINKLGLKNTASLVKLAIETNLGKNTG